MFDLLRDGRAAAPAVFQKATSIEHDLERVILYPSIRA